MFFRTQGQSFVKALNLEVTEALGSTDPDPGLVNKKLLFQGVEPQKCWSPGFPSSPPGFHYTLRGYTSYHLFIGSWEQASGVRGGGRR